MGSCGELLLSTSWRETVHKRRKKNAIDSTGKRTHLLISVSSKKTFILFLYTHKYYLEKTAYIGKIIIVFINHVYY